MRVLEALVEASSSLEMGLQNLADCFDPPKLITIQGRPAFRHERKDDLLQSYLKCVRCVSLLKASLKLLPAGHVYEIYVLTRCIDECVEDVFFLARARGENGSPSSDQMRLIGDFYQEEFENFDDPLNTGVKRDRLKREKVQAAIASDVGAPLNPHDSKQSSKTLHKAFSGYVHSAYPHIMESYSVRDGVGRFSTSGLLGSPRIAECLEVLSSRVFQSLLAARVVAKRCGAEDVDRQLDVATDRLVSAWPELDEDGGAVLRRIKARARTGKA